MPTPLKRRMLHLERLPHRDAIRRLLQAYAMLYGNEQVTPTSVSKQEDR